MRIGGILDISPQNKEVTMPINPVNGSKTYSHEDAITLFIEQLYDMDGRAISDIANEIQNYITISYLQDSLWQSSAIGSTRLIGTEELFDFFRRALSISEETLIKAFADHTEHTLFPFGDNGEFSIALEHLQGLTRG